MVGNLELGIKLPGGLTTVLCPVCNVATIVVEHKNIELDYCTGCQGVWFDAGELELLLESEGLEVHRAFLDTMINSPAADVAEKKRRCPICRRKMKKACIDGEGKILIDVCGHGDGIWFDGGELDNLLDSLAAGSAGKTAPQQKVFGHLGDTLKSRPTRK